MSSRSTAHPLSRLMRYSHTHQKTVWAAIACSVLNKIFDLAPPVLIGMAVDVVVEQQDSFLASLGFKDITNQLAIISVLTLIVWALESVFQYAYDRLWRNLAQTTTYREFNPAYTLTKIE